MLGGTSPFKNTAYVLHNWLENNCFTDIDPDIKLVITCKGLCYDNMLKIFKKYLKYNISEKLSLGKEGKGNPIIKYRNITLYNSLVPEETYKNLIQSANVALCPSAKEGFGHYINESRNFNTIVVTIDEPPMNELINDKTGLLIKSYEKIDQNIKFTNYKLYTVYPTNSGLTDAITYCIKNKNNPKILNINSRKYFKKDLIFFKDAFRSEIISLFSS
jgi:hypothetical protein